MRKSLIIVLCLVFAAGTLSGARPQKRDSSVEVTVFSRGEGGYDTFRIPALIQIPGGDILAFAEARKNGAGDTGDIDLVVKRSCDGGLSWSRFYIVWDDGENVCGNPAPAVDQRTGKIVLVMTWNDGRDSEKQITAGQSIDTRRPYVTFSEDGGLSWSTPVDITAEAKLPHWTWYATGPCHAIQLVRGPHKGRIVVPCNHNVLAKGAVQGSASHLIYSDDGGVSWHIGGMLPVGNESTVCELPSGKLLYNLRGLRSKDRAKFPYRWMASSEDGGESFCDLHLDYSLEEPWCNGSMTNYAPAGSLSRRILFCNPENPSRRTSMTVKMSRDGGASWTKFKSIPGKCAAYSDICVLSDGRVAVLYENGDASPYERISFIAE